MVKNSGNIPSTGFTSTVDGITYDYRRIYEVSENDTDSVQVTDNLPIGSSINVDGKEYYFKSVPSLNGTANSDNKLSIISNFFCPF